MIRHTWKAALFGYAPSLALPTQMAIEPISLNKTLFARLSFFHLEMNSLSRLWNICLSMTISSDMAGAMVGIRRKCLVFGRRKEL